jgi:hypothetical protein
MICDEALQAVKGLKTDRRSLTTEYCNIAILVSGQGCLLKWAQKRTLFPILLRGRERGGGGSTWSST